MMGSFVFLIVHHFKQPRGDIPGYVNDVSLWLEVVSSHGDWIYPNKNGEAVKWDELDWVFEQKSDSSLNPLHFLTPEHYYLSPIC